MDNFESLSAWLHRLEEVLRRDKKHFYSCSPEEQRTKIKVYDNLLLKCFSRTTHVKILQLAASSLTGCQ